MVTEQKSTPQTPTEEQVKHLLTLEELKGYSLPGSTADVVDMMSSVFDVKYREQGKYFPKSEELENLLKIPHKEIQRPYETTVAQYADEWAPSIIRMSDDGEKRIKNEHGIIDENAYKDRCKNIPILAILEKALALHSSNTAVDDETEKMYFSAFAVATHYERLQKNHYREAYLFERYGSMFSGFLPKARGFQNKPAHPYYYHLLLLKDMDRVLDLTFEERKLLLKQAEDNSKRLTENYGGHHAFAETVALVFEGLTNEQRDTLPEGGKKLLDKAKNSAILAIDHSPDYAKFYCTYSRVAALLGDFDEALVNVQNAIALEKSSRKDYSIRIGQYSSYYQQFRAQKRIEEQKIALDEKVREVTKEMESREKETLTKNMEFLGLFAGIVSFTIGSLTLASDVGSIEPMQIAGLIVVLLGALICVFAAFGVILHGFIGTFKSRKGGKTKYYLILRHILVFILGALIVMGGIEHCIK